MITMFSGAKLLVCLVSRHRGEDLVAVAKSAGARGGTITFGRTIGDNPILRALALADVHQDIMFTLMGDEAAPVVDAIKKAAKEHPKKLGGLAVLLDVAGVLRRCSAAAQPQEAPLQDTERKCMDSGYKLITVITNFGFADDVMSAARKAGATGGTILNARGTGTEEDVRFFGITLVPEKDMLFIVADSCKAQDIIDAVTVLPNMNEPGCGIIYTMNVEEFVVLGQ